MLSKTVFFLVFQERVYQNQKALSKKKIAKILRDNLNIHILTRCAGFALAAKL